VIMHVGVTVNALLFWLLHGLRVSWLHARHRARYRYAVEIRARLGCYVRRLYRPIYTDPGRQPVMMVRGLSSCKSLPVSGSP
jgi:hypothetical protein